VTIDPVTNDTDADNALDVGSISIVSAPANGTLVDNGDGTLTYTHDGSETLSDSFTYTIDDVAGASSNTVSVDLVVTPQNDAPVSADAAIEIDGDTVYAGRLPTVSDPDSSTVSFSLDTAPDRGTVELNSDGSFSYTPDPGSQGSDSFTYSISDGEGGRNTYTVAVYVVAAATDDTSPTGNGTGTEEGTWAEITPSLDFQPSDGDEEPESAPTDEEGTQPEAAGADSLTSGTVGAGIPQMEAPSSEDDSAAEADAALFDAALFTDADPGNDGQAAGLAAAHHVNGEGQRDLWGRKLLLARHQGGAESPKKGALEVSSPLALSDTRAGETIDAHLEYDELRAQLDESFEEERGALSRKVALFTTALTAFTVGFVSYFLRAGSMAAGWISTVPLWRGFDPIAIFGGDRRKKRAPDQEEADEAARPETLFDDGPK
jgi:hypothetical protein